MENNTSVKQKIYPGLNVAIFESYKQEITEWPAEKKYCSIVFDKIELTPHLDYNTQLDLILGFVTTTGGKQLKYIADHALVFVLQGCVHEWSKIAAVYFCEEQNDKSEMKKIIEEVVLAVTGSGFLPLTFVTTPAANFQQPLKEMQTKDGTIIIKGTELNIIYDPSHLLCGMRNHLAQQGSLSFDNHVAQYNDIVSVYTIEKTKVEKDPAKEWFWSLTEEDVMLDKLNKKKITSAAKIFSSQMGKLMSELASRPEANAMDSTTMRDTAELLEFFGNLYDSMTKGNTQSGKLEGTACVEQNTALDLYKNKDFWRSAIQKLESIQFVDCTRRPVTVANWIETIKSALRICDLLYAKNVPNVTIKLFRTSPVHRVFEIITKVHKEKVTCKKFLKTFGKLVKGIP